MHVSVRSVGKKVFMYKSQFFRWTQSQAKKDDTDEVISKYDGEYQICTYSRP